MTTHNVKVVQPFQARAPIKTIKRKYRTHNTQAPDVIYAQRMRGDMIIQMKTTRGNRNGKQLTKCRFAINNQRCVGQTKMATLSRWWLFPETLEGVSMELVWG